MERLVYGTCLSEEIRQECLKVKGKVHTGRDHEGPEGE
jgi:hypothetical protein